jgi:hypothetical protein
VVEYLQGNDGSLLQHEYYIYALDALLMLVVMVIFNLIHPSGITSWVKGSGRETIDVHLERFYGRI